jgi:predicted lipoprotein with Yx(FWY)xxD motif
MKTRIIILVFAAFLAIPLLLNAQSPLDKIFNKYSGQDKFTTVSISKEMFTQILSMAASQNDSASREMKGIMDKLTGLKVITYDIDTMDYSKAVSIYNEWAGIFPPSTYKELMAVTEGRDNYKFMTKQDADGKISEMVMLMKGRKELVVISLTGVIDMSNVSKISRSMGIHGMEGFQHMHQRHQAPPPPPAKK